MTKPLQATSLEILEDNLPTPRALNTTLQLSNSLNSSTGRVRPVPKTYTVVSRDIPNLAPPASHLCLIAFLKSQPHQQPQSEEEDVVPAASDKPLAESSQSNAFFETNTITFGEEIHDWEDVSFSSPTTVCSPSPKTDASSPKKPQTPRNTRNKFLYNTTESSPRSPRSPHSASSRRRVPTPRLSTSFKFGKKTIRFDNKLGSPFPRQGRRGLYAPTTLVAKPSRIKADKKAKRKAKELFEKQLWEERKNDPAYFTAEGYNRVELDRFFGVTSEDSKAARGGYISLRGLPEHKKWQKDSDFKPLIDKEIRLKTSSDIGSESDGDNSPTSNVITISSAASVCSVSTQMTAMSLGSDVVKSRPRSRPPPLDLKETIAKSQSTLNQVATSDLDSPGIRSPRPRASKSRLGSVLKGLIKKKKNQS